MIQTYKPFTTHKTTLFLQAKRVKEWPILLTWNDIKCKVNSDWLKHSPCDVGNEKIFVKYKSNTHVAGFGLYLLMMMTGEINVEKHKEFVKLMQQTLKTVIIHNEEVDWFHLKEYKNNLTE